MLPIARRAEEAVFTDPMVSGFFSRRSLEQFVWWLYDNDQELTIPADKALSSLMHEQSFINLVPAAPWRQLNVVRKIGNNATHGNTNTSVKDALQAVKMMHDFALWVVRVWVYFQIPNIVQHRM